MSFSCVMLQILSKVTSNSILSLEAYFKSFCNAENVLIKYIHSSFDNFLDCNCNCVYSSEETSNNEKASSIVLQISIFLK